MLNCENTNALSCIGDSINTKCSVGGMRGNIDVLMAFSSLEDCESVNDPVAGKDEETPTTASLTFRLYCK